MPSGTVPRGTRRGMVISLLWSLSALLIAVSLCSRSLTPPSVSRSWPTPCPSLPADRHRRGVPQRGRGRKVIRASGVRREDLFITTKLWIQDAGDHTTKAVVEKSLARHGGFGERPGETDQEQSRHRAAGRLDHTTRHKKGPGP
jgi:hypothetical protein